MHTCMMPVAPNRLVNISSVLEYASVLIGVHQVKYMEVQTMDAVKILMVDDEERMRKLVKDFLTIKGYRVLEAGDGEQAIDIFFKEKDISLVILDVMMPKMDGWETCKTIRRYSQVPIIMLTARSGMSFLDSNSALTSISQNRSARRSLWRELRRSCVVAAVHQRVRFWRQMESAWIRMPTRCQWTESQWISATRNLNFLPILWKTKESPSQEKRF